VSGGGEGAGFRSAEDAVAVARDNTVTPVAERTGKQSQERRNDSPEQRSGRGWCRRGGGLACSHMCEDENNRVRTRQQLLGCPFAIEHDVNRIEVPSVCSMPGQNALSQRALQRGEAKDPLGIAAQNELHEPVAQTAHTVVKQDRMCRWVFAHAMTLASAVQSPRPSGQSKTGKIYCHVDPRRRSSERRRRCC
jgi:hypothetical protein